MSDTADGRVDDLAADLDFVRRLTGTYEADVARGYYAAADRVFDALQDYLDQERERET